MPTGSKQAALQEIHQKLGSGQWIETVCAIRKRNNISEPHDCVGIVSSILTDEALSYFAASLVEQTRQQQEDEEECTVEVALTNEMVHKAIKAVSVAIFLPWTLEAQTMDEKASQKTFHHAVQAIRIKDNENKSCPTFLSRKIWIL